MQSVFKSKVAEENGIFYCDYCYHKKYSSYLLMSLPGFSQSTSVLTNHSSYMIITHVNILKKTRKILVFYKTGFPLVVFLEGVQQLENSILECLSS